MGQCGLGLKCIILCIACTSANPLWPPSLLCIWELVLAFFKVEMKLEAVPPTLEPSFRVTEVWRRMKQTAGLGSWGGGAAEAWVGFSHSGAFSGNAAQLSFFVAQHKASVWFITVWPQNPHQLFSRRRLWIDATTGKGMSGLQSRTFLSACKREKFRILASI